MTIPRIVKVYAKTVMVFLSGWLFNVIVDLVKGEKPWPQNKEEWLQYLLTSLGVAFVAFMTKNKFTQKQLDKDPNVMGGIVIDDPVNLPVVEKIDADNSEAPPLGGDGASGPDKPNLWT